MGSDIPNYEMAENILLFPLYPLVRICGIECSKEITEIRTLEYVINSIFLFHFN